MCLMSSVLVSTVVGMERSMWVLCLSRLTYILDQERNVLSHSQVFLIKCLLPFDRLVQKKYPSSLLARLSGKQRFLIPFNVLDLVYGQTVSWVGVYYCPLLPLIGTVTLVVTFYIKKVGWNMPATDHPLLTKSCLNSFSFETINTVTVSGAPECFQVNAEDRVKRLGLWSIRQKQSSRFSGKHNFRAQQVHKKEELQCRLGGWVRQVTQTPGDKWKKKKEWVKPWQQIDKF